MCLPRHVEKTDKIFRLQRKYLRVTENIQVTETTFKSKKNIWPKRCLWAKNICMFRNLKIFDARLGRGTAGGTAAGPPTRTWPWPPSTSSEVSTTLSHCNNFTLTAVTFCCHSLFLLSIVSSSSIRNVVIVKHMTVTMCFWVKRHQIQGRD